MCFNAAKTRHFNWFPNHYAAVVPSTNVQEVVLTSLADVGNSNTYSNSKMILKLESSQSTLFINFNRVKKLYNDVLDSDKVVITVQNSASSASIVKAALESGGKSLIVEVINIDINWNTDNNLDNTRVKIYVSGEGHLPAPAPTPVLAPIPLCSDVPDWYDSDGPAYDCGGWYAIGSRCAQYGHSFAKFGKTANASYCACQSGLAPAPAPTKAPTPTSACTILTARLMIADGMRSLACVLSMETRSRSLEKLQRKHVARANDLNDAIVQSYEPAVLDFPKIYSNQIFLYITYEKCLGFLIN